ncbi:hypothetical protein DXG03_001597 [Asterophora parasitica]|uniref:cAMP-independent regulatory protein pac2 n=1 Tax=Asterophora parasitica TaxID=117018 RepID=A0A9P7G563_9AGAR|nr:hypothetical protein DXG03_001597 [Asterophora parasitica]
MGEATLFQTPASVRALSSITSMQNPTLQNVRVRSVRDALQVFYGVATNLLPLITRRLDAEERRAIGSGNVYVWEERGANSEPTGLGMERWTDGMGWGPSRVRDEFLFYHQKESNFSDELINPITPWAQMMWKREQASSHTSGYPSIQPERLVKQTQQRLDELGTIDRIRGVGDVAVPDGLFRSARAGKMRRDHRKPSKKVQPPDLTIHPGDPQVGRDQASSEVSRLPESPSFSNPISLSPPFSAHSRDSSPSSESLNPQSGFSDDQPKLVPLEYLQNVSGARRNPVDEQFLRRFSPQTICPISVPPRPPFRTS